MFLVYPLLGHLTDVYLTSYCTLKCGLVNQQPFAEGICTCSCWFMCVHVCVCVIHAVHSMCLSSLHLLGQVEVDVKFYTYCQLTVHF